MQPFGRASSARGALVSLLLLLATAAGRAAAADAVPGLAYDQPIPGGQVVTVVWNVTVARRAPDCFGERRVGDAREKKSEPAGRVAPCPHPTSSPLFPARDVLLINGRFLRNATVTLHRGDVLDITLLNSLPPAFPDVEQGLTLHFHGLAMAAPGGAQWYDGVPYLHQCPVRPGGGSLRYRFRIDDGPGTFWVHAHTMQIMDGLFAPLVVLPPRGAPDPALAGTVVQGTPPAVDIPVMVGDWYHTSATGLQVGLQRPYDPAKVVKGGATGGAHDHGGGHGGEDKGTGAWVWVNQPQAVLFNGRGFFGDCPVGAAGSKAEPVCAVGALTIPPGRTAANPTATTSDPGCTHEVIAIPPGRTSRLRLIGTGSLAYLTICVEGHNLTIVAADGVAVSPFAAPCVDLNLGQRLDVLVTADKGVAGDVFWVAALPQFRPGSPAGYAGEKQGGGGGGGAGPAAGQGGRRESAGPRLDPASSRPHACSRISSLSTPSPPPPPLSLSLSLSLSPPLLRRRVQRHRPPALHPPTPARQCAALGRGGPGPRAGAGVGAVPARVGQRLRRRRHPGPTRRRPPAVRVRRLPPPRHQRAGGPPQHHAAPAGADGPGAVGVQQRGDGRDARVWRLPGRRPGAGDGVGQGPGSRDGGPGGGRG